MNIKHTRLQILAATTLLTVSQSAFALSCMKPDPVQICQQMQQQQLSPIWADGQLSLQRIISQEENEMNIGAKGAAVADYAFTGTLTDQSGVRNVKNAALRITTSCAGPWCASLPENGKSGYFLLEAKGKSAMELHIGPCTFVPYTVTEQEKKAIAACVQPQTQTQSHVPGKSGCDDKKKKI